MFRYQGQLREELWFSSPNLCGAFLVMILPLLWWGTAWLVDLFYKSSQRQLPLRILMGAGIVTVALLCVWVTFLLARTYSRGAWVAYGCGLGLWLVSCFRTFPKSSFRCLAPFAALAVFVVLLLLVPGGIDRSFAMADQADLSIANRMEAWKGALATIAENPWKGVGAKQFAEYYWNWHQTRELTSRYPGALNNSLCLAAERGLPVLWLHLAIICAAIIPALHLKDYPFASAVASGLAAYLIAGCFTGTLGKWIVDGWFWLLWLVLIVIIIKRGYLGEKWSYKRVLWVGACSSLLICLVVGITSTWARTLLPYRLDSIRFKGKQWSVLSPQKIRAKGVVIYFGLSGETTDQLARNVLRIFVERGFVAASSKIDDQFTNSLKEVQPIWDWVMANQKWNGIPRFYAGYRQGGERAIQLVCDPDEVSIHGVATFGSVGGLSNETLSQLRCPLLLLHSEHDHLIPWEDAQAMSQTISNMGKKSELKIMPGTSHYLTGREMREMITMMADWFDSQQATRPE